MLPVVKNLPANAGDSKRWGFDPWVRKIPWRGAQQPTPVFLPGDPTDRGAWEAAAHGIAKSQTWLKRLSTHAPLKSTFSLFLAGWPQRSNTWAQGLGTSRQKGENQSMGSTGFWDNRVWRPSVAAPYLKQTSWGSGQALQPGRSTSWAGRKRHIKCACDVVIIIINF